MNDRCDWASCRKPADMGYQKNNKDPKKELCQEHFEKLCDMQEQSKENDARKKIGLPPLASKPTPTIKSTPVEVIQQAEIPIIIDSDLVKSMKSVRIPKGFL